MSWKFWKSPKERFDEEWNKAVSLRNQAKWTEAAEHFQEAAKISAEVQEPEYRKKGELAMAYALLYQAVAFKTPDSVKRAYDAISRLDPNTVMEIPNKVTAGELAQELNVLVLQYQLPPMSLSNLASQNLHTAEMYEKLAQQYLSLGKDKLVLNDLFGIPQTPQIAAFRYLGYSKLIQGYLKEKEDPEKAVEYYAEAMGYFAQAQAEEFRAYADTKSKKIGSVAKCWFCGRTVQGEDIHYFYLNAITTPYFSKKYGTESPTTMSGDKVIACLSCYSSINNIADAVAKAYFQKAMQEIAILRERVEKLEAEVRALRSSVYFRR